MAASPRAAAAPILELYRSIIRVHKHKLVGPLKELGDDYVRSEFRAHREFWDWEFGLGGGRPFTRP